VRLATPPRVGSGGANARSRTSAHRGSLSRMLRGSSAEFIVRRGDATSEFSADFDAEEQDEDEVDVEREIAGDGNVDWKRRAMVLRRKVRELETELRAVKRRVMEAVMA
jgi:TATA-binding protein-associated factor Taf7